MQVKIQKNDKERSITDQVAMALDATFNGKETVERLYKGIHSIPYNDNYEEKSQSPEIYITYFDELVEDQPHSYSFRFWGNNTERFLEELNNLGFEIKEKNNE
jgi:hypothetical protein